MTEFDDVIRLLRENRPEATELELDQIKQRVRNRAARPSRRKQDMKSRLAILAMLVLGMTLSTTGAGLAVQSLSSGDDASIAQYETPDDTPGDVLGEQDTSSGPCVENGTGGGANGGGGAGNGGAADECAESSPDLQPTRQAEVGSDTGDELPFTGFLAIPVLIGGVALLSTGLVLRRRTSDERE
jgi:hypothetical protein